MLTRIRLTSILQSVRSGPGRAVISLRSEATVNKNAVSTKPFENVPTRTGIYSWKYIGLILQMKPFTKNSSYGEFVHGLHREYGDIFKQRVGKGWVVYLFNPADIEVVLREESRYPYKSPLVLSSIFEKRKNIRPSLASLNGEEWRSRRQVAQEKMLRPAAVRNYAPLINDVADDFMVILKAEGRMKDTLRMMMSYATESIGMLCFNKRLGCLQRSRESDELMFHVRQLFHQLGEHFYHTSNNLTCFLYHLAKYPEVQDKLYNEVMTKMQSTDGNIDYSALNSMPYMTACVRESFRVIFPVMLGPLRIIEKPMVLGGYNIPSWTPIHLCSQIACQDSRNFDGPTIFRPERWLRDESGKRNIHPFVFLPFGFGVRNCLGQRFALQEMYIFTAKLLKHFRLKLPPGTEEEDLQYHYKTFVLPSNTVDIILEER
ncbi:hypothetical protein KUTeg_019895 [Tegillarca granosa]|uniref:Cytochrome P450 n=1 Tax=Tegillarca granosa TaxID=220873 RepID=A0ABQ9EDT7_TEGGR|nr:hypothetical protein KUTeg_019895 [Tegillarca granosa]